MAGEDAEVDTTSPKQITSKRKEKGNLKQPPEDSLGVLGECVEECLEGKKRIALAHMAKGTCVKENEEVVTSSITRGVEWGG